MRLLALAELPAMVLVQSVVDRDPHEQGWLLTRVAGRRGSQAAFFVVCGAALGGVAAATLLLGDGSGGLLLVLALVGKLGASGAFTVRAPPSPPRVGRGRDVTTHIYMESWCL